jgi:hypothetical protein
VDEINHGQIEKGLKNDLAPLIENVRVVANFPNELQCCIHEYFKIHEVNRRGSKQGIDLLSKRTPHDCISLNASFENYLDIEFSCIQKHP